MHIGGIVREYPMPQQIDPDTPTLTTAQAARRLNRSPEWVSQLLTAGRIKGEKVGHYWHVDAASLEEFIANGRRPRGPKTKAPAKTAALDAPLDDSEREYHYPGVIRLVYAVLELAAEEAVAGDLPAQLWVDSPQSDHWFQIADIDPDTARAAIKRRRKPTHRDVERIEQAIALHNMGATWKAAFMQVFGYYSETLRYRAARYAEALEMAGQAN